MALPAGVIRVPVCLYLRPLPNRVSVVAHVAKIPAIR